MADRRYHIAVDTGGTFTDLVAIDRRTRAVLSVKVPSTPADPARALLAALAETGLEGAQIAFFGHSTTVALNALLQRRGARTGLITTAGFRDVLEIGRFNRPEMYNAIAKYTKLPPAVVSSLAPPNLQVDTTPQQVKFWVDLAKEQAAIKGDPDLAKIIYEPK